MVLALLVLVLLLLHHQSPGADPKTLAIIASLQARALDAAIEHPELPHHNVFCREILVAVLVGFSDAAFDSELPPHPSDNVICRAILLAVPVRFLMLQSTLRVLTFRAMSFVLQFCLQSLQAFLMLQS